MTFKPTSWTRLGLGVAVLGAALAACSNPSGDARVDVSVTQQEAGTSGHHTDALPREHRLAFMMGHVEAGLALYRAGKLDMAAPHLLHPVSETHMSEREGLDELGFDGTLFEAVSEALENGTAAAQIEPQLKAAEANLRLVSERAGGETAGIIRFLMETVDEEYTIAITDGHVTDPGEYQDAYGFSVVARKLANSLNSRAGADVASKLDALIEMWPSGGPIPPANPASIAEITAKTSEIRLLLH